MLSYLYNAFALFAQVVRHVLRGNPSHFKVLREFYMCFFMTIALPHIYAPICVYFPFLYLFHNFMNMIGVSDAEYIRSIAVRLLQCTNPI